MASTRKSSPTAARPDIGPDGLEHSLQLLALQFSQLLIAIAEAQHLSAASRATYLVQRVAGQNALSSDALQDLLGGTADALDIVRTQSLACVDMLELHRRFVIASARRSALRHGWQQGEDQS